MENLPDNFDSLRFQFDKVEEFDACMAIGRRHKFPDSEIRIFIANRLHNGKIMKMNVRTGNWENLKAIRIEQELINFCMARQMAANRNED